MALILSIDTATEYAGICLSKDGEVIASEEHVDQKNHASFLQPAIQNMMQREGIALKMIDAVAVTGGPGSYTGIRVGLASTKGICYALNKPLIVLNTLQIIAAATKSAYLNQYGVIDPNTLFFPMIDARRMEVFAGMYNYELEEQTIAAAIILEETFFSNLPSHNIIFCGNGAVKIPTEYLNNARRLYAVPHSVIDIVRFAEHNFNNKNFSDLVFSAPNYIKEFYNIKNN